MKESEKEKETRNSKNSAEVSKLEEVFSVRFFYKRYSFYSYTKAIKYSSLQRKFVWKEIISIENKNI